MKLNITIFQMNQDVTVERVRMVLRAGKQWIAMNASVVVTSLDHIVKMVGGVVFANWVIFHSRFILYSAFEIFYL